MFNFTENYLSIEATEFLDSVGEERRKQILKCFRPKHQRITKEIKVVCICIQDEYKAWKKKKLTPGLSVPPKWFNSFESQLRVIMCKTTAKTIAAAKITAYDAKRKANLEYCEARRVAADKREAEEAEQEEEADRRTEMQEMMGGG
jgi:hypothetical protein